MNIKSPEGVEEILELMSLGEYTIEEILQAVVFKTKSELVLFEVAGMIV